MALCEQCHLETTSRSLPDRIPHYDQESFGYMVAERLASFNSYFSRDPAKGPTDNFEIVNSPYRLWQSQCYLKSQRALTCGTCHNPHDLHKRPEVVSYSVVLLQMNRVPDAKKEAEAAVKAAPKSPWANDLLEQILATLGSKRKRTNRLRCGSGFPMGVDNGCADVLLLWPQLFYLQTY